MPNSASARPDFQALEGGLCCPDDGAVVAWEGNGYECPLCRRAFPVVAGRVLEILPTEPSDLPAQESSETYAAGYLADHAVGMENEIGSGHSAWGTDGSAPAAWLRRKERQVAFSLPLMLNGRRPEGLVIADFGGGPGFHTFAWADRVRHFVHCDLSARNLGYVARRLDAEGISNVLLVRMDYLKSPFRRAFDAVICFDTLFQGPRQDASIASAIYEALAPGGVAVVDFHNWWHNPIRRLGLLRDTFAGNTSYSRAQAREVLAGAGIPHTEYAGFHQEFSPDHWAAELLRHFVPPTRLTFRYSR